jgi:chemotaxis protein CheD
MTHHTVGIAQLKTAEAEDVLVTLGLGSCVVVAIYDSELKRGSLAHIMLPHEAFGRRREGENMLKYADVAIPASVHLLEERGCSRSGMTAKIAGGACMFDLSKDGQADIGQRNIQAAEEVLASLDIPLVAVDTGGTRGRSVEFRMDSGELRVRTVYGPEKVI